MHTNSKNRDISLFIYLCIYVTIIKEKVFNLKWMGKKRGLRGNMRRYEWKKEKRRSDISIF